MVRGWRKGSRRSCGRGDRRGGAVHDPGKLPPVSRLADYAEGVFGRDRYRPARERIWQVGGAPVIDGSVVVDIDATRRPPFSPEGWR